MLAFLKKLFEKKPKVEKVDLTSRFDLIGRIGQGSMSKVFRGRDPATDRMYAVKLLDMPKTRKLDERFLAKGITRPSEGEIAVQLDHPRIVKTYEHGWTVDNEIFLVMEFVEGVSLSFLIDTQNEHMQQGRLQFMIELGEAIEYFHSKNLIHRDICPRNILLDEEYHIKLIDFGLVVPNTPPFQQPGNRTGTAQYMAPELMKRKKTDQRIDIFSYAMTCFEMYANRLPWDSTGQTIDLMQQRINTPPADIREFVSDIDEDVAETIMRGLESDPDSRWASASQMVARFRDARLRLDGTGN
ncbi:MAG TPA: serine/threonine protein kinase [Planctomycetaceae bacterium]|jgi:serine/threonine protein kinase|nr:serine/threonine protein kinase [Planctomycetaceae bacterium]HCK53399.1 serine/threonine protein kinase [Planctomycetaceae bacterium]|tara:strand:+ start:137 stop:1033 length:897 start_codon:yes stop_codon:yes gene_type:complete